jgi:hypothetical protein
LSAAACVVALLKGFFKSWLWFTLRPRSAGGFRCAPKGLITSGGRTHSKQLMVRFDSWRALSAGNRADRNLATKSTHGGRAIWQAVTRVKLEQASKAAMWTPTRPETGEGRTDGEEPGAGARQTHNQTAPIGSTGVVSTACQKGNRASVGEARDGRGNREPQTSPARAADHLGVGEGQRRPGSRVTPVEGRALASGAFEKEGRTGD